MQIKITQRGDPPLFAIDPGLSGCGWALFPARVLTPSHVGTLYCKDGNWWDRAHTLAKLLLNECPRHWGQGIVVVCEFPQQMMSAAGTAAQKDANIYKLAYLVGAVGHMASERLDIGKRFYPVHPQQWKGQLPKHVVETRIRRALSPGVCRRLNIRSHAWDAVGIGLWARGSKEFVS